MGIWYAIIALSVFTLDKLKATEYRHMNKTDDWILRPNSNDSYIFCENRTSWSHSRLKCQELGGDLLVIRSQQEQDWLTEIMKEKSYATYSWGIGLTDWEFEGNWKWIDGSPINVNITKWKAREPNNIPAARNCVAYYMTKHLIDLRCSYKHCFVCMNGNATETYYDYFFNTNIMSWYLAYKFCKSKGQLLATIKSEDQAKLFESKAKNISSNCDSWWVGLEKTASNYWKWIDQDFLNVSFLSWNENSPTKVLTEDCAEIINGTLNDYVCHYARPFICKKEFNPSTPEDTTKRAFKSRRRLPD